VVSDAEDFAGSQGDVWDAQADMLMALCGAIVAQLAVGRGLHDRQITRLEGR
jgi:putative membrane protein